MRIMRSDIYESIAYDTAVDLSLTNKLPQFRIVDKHDDGSIGKRIILKNNDELISVAADTCLNLQIPLEQAIRHEFYHVYQRRQEVLHDSLAYWDSLIEKYPLDHRIYKLSALELSAHVYANTSDIEEADSVFLLFPDISVLESFSVQQVLNLGYTVFQDLSSHNKLHWYVCDSYSRIKLT